MSILSVILVFVLVGVVLWAVNSFIPMDGNVKKVMNIAVIVILVLWVLSLFGVLGHLENIQVPHT